jgi:hypothetical protein
VNSTHYTNPILLFYKGAAMNQQTLTTLNQPLFASAASAAAFALNFSSESYQTSAVNRMAGTPAPSGKGLGGLDGAAQSGMIRAELAGIGFMGEAIIVAEMAHKTKPCPCKAPCCSGEIVNREWAAAIGLLSNFLKETKIAPAYFIVRTNLLRRYFGVDISISEIARHSQLSRDTITAYNAKVTSFLKVEKKLAWAQFDQRLMERGIIDPIENPCVGGSIPPRATKKHQNHLRVVCSIVAWD